MTFNSYVRYGIMIESGLNIRSEARIMCYLQLIGSRHETDVNDNNDDKDKEILREIDLHSVRHLFVLISRCYCLALIFSILEQILYKVTNKLLSGNKQEGINFNIT